VQCSWRASEVKRKLSTPSPRSEPGLFGKDGFVARDSVYVSISRIADFSLGSYERFVSSLPP
jgi:hypothetical protein